MVRKGGLGGRPSFLSLPVTRLLLSHSQPSVDLPCLLCPCVRACGRRRRRRRWCRYLGVTHPRLHGDAYYSLVHEFVCAVQHRWPNAVVQFEDFSSDKALDILETYR